MLIFSNLGCANETLFLGAFRCAAPFQLAEVLRGGGGKGGERKQQVYCGRASESRTKVVQDHPNTPFSIRTADAGGHEYIMPGAKSCFLRKPISFLRPACETQLWGAGAHGETPQDPHNVPVRRPEAGAVPRLHILSM